MAGLRNVTAPLVVVSAPAGAGKTIGLCQWLRSDERQAVWLHLDAGDNDPVTLLHYVARALGHVTPLDPAVRSWLCLPHPPLHHVIVPTLLAAASTGPPFIFVLDDIHAMRELRCWAVLWPILEALAAGSTAVLCGRSDPPLPLARLRAEERIAEFRFEQFAFDRDEARKLLALHRLPTDQDLVGRLLATTEGWAAGLHFAVLAVKKSGSLDLRLSPADCRDDIADYLASEALAERPPALVEFLTRTSIVDRLSPELCNVLTGRSDGIDLLRTVERENLFVVPLGEERGWYRYHHLFAELLESELQRREPELVPELHRRAARWFAERDQLLVALRHWLAAGDLARAGDLIASRWRTRMDTGRLLKTRLWLDECEPGQILSYPPLTVAAAWIRALTGEADAARGLLATLDPKVLDRPSPDGAASLRSSVAVLECLLGSGGPAGMRRNARLALDLERNRGRASLWLELAAHVAGVAEMLSGDPHGAAELLRQAAEQSCGAHSRVELAALGDLSLIAGDERRWDDAERYAAEAAARAVWFDLEGYLPSIPASIARDRLRARAGDDDAVVALEELLESLDPNLFQWIGPRVALALAEIAIDRSDVPGARRWLADARARLARWADAPGLARLIDRLEDLALARLLTEPVSPAERRVLELLPTHLTTKGIAARLSVSPNTVNTHMSALHRKLGVTSRSEAVKRALELGLLEPWTSPPPD